VVHHPASKTSDAIKQGESLYEEIRRWILTVLSVLSAVVALFARATDVADDFAEDT
jgi:hypothetical protein